MSKSTDFSNMTLEELTPIVSMRPGKEYTREQLREARSAFMALLADSDGADCAPAEEISAESPASAMSVSPEKPFSEVTEAVFAAAEAAENAPVQEMPRTPAFAEAPVAVPENTDETPVQAPEPEPYVAFSAVPITAVEAAAESAGEEAAPKAADAPEETMRETVEAHEEAAAEPEEEFILKTDSRLARFLYILYAYLVVPLLAVEALVFLLASVAAAVAVPNIPYLLLHIFCAALYTMSVAVAWHQLLHRTKFGLLLNRALIGVCAFRGIFMLFLGETLSGILFIALSVLFLVFFLGYDSTFIVKSPAKQRAR